MGQLIHTKQTPDGVRFRLWSTNSDNYLTDEMTEAETREYILKVAVCETIERHNREIEGRIQQAISNGTSSMIGDSRDPNGDWDIPLNP